MNPWLTFTVGLPTLAQGYVVGLLTLMLGITRAPHFDGPVLATSWRPWFEKRWGYTTTIGAWMGRASWYSTKTDFHERVHLRQYIDLNFLGLVLGACLVPWIGWQGMLILWGTSGAPWLLPNFITGWIRFGDPYMGAEHELSAYAQTERVF
jgi:hypothetical protein